MSFLGLLGVEHPWCIGCDSPIHADFLPTDITQGEDCPIDDTFYTCPKCGLVMSIESNGDGTFNVYPDEDTLPEDSSVYF